MLLRLAVAPLAMTGWAQEKGKTRRVGYLRGPDTEIFAKPLAALGWIEGKNLHFEQRANKTLEPAELEKLAGELVRANVDALLAFTTPRVRALAAATRTIPIVCAGSADPIGDGFAKSLQRPGGNVTGLSYAVPERAQFSIQILRAFRPGLARVLLMVPSIAAASPLPVPKALAATAKAAGIAFDLTEPASIAEVEQLFTRLQPERDAVIVDSDIEPEKVAAIAIRHRIATSGSNVHKGLLMHSYLQHTDQIARVAAILDKVLRGGNPAEIPFELPDRTTLIVNRTTAKAINLAVPPEIALRATELLD